MKVKIKSFDVGMEVKQKGIEFEVRKPDGSAQIGDCYITMTKLIWCSTKVRKENGIWLSWAEFAEILQSKESKKAAIAAARDA